jgi:hypothetical protein
MIADQPSNAIEDQRTSEPSQLSIITEDHDETVCNDVIDRDTQEEEELSVVFNAIWNDGEIAVPNVQNEHDPPLSPSITATALRDRIVEQFVELLVNPSNAVVDDNNDDENEDASSTTISTLSTTNFHYSLRTNRGQDIEDRTSSTAAVEPESITVPANISVDVPIDDTTDTEQTPRQRLRCCRRVTYWFARLICFPFWLLASIFTISSVIAFCIFPGIILIGIMVTCYYCCSRDPIPFHVLMQALFFDDENDDANNNNNTPTRTKEEIRQLLICRTCMLVRTNTSQSSVYQPNHKEIVSKKPITIATDNHVILFSEPIDTHEDDGNEVIIKLDDLLEKKADQIPQFANFASEDFECISSVDAVRATTGNYNNDDDDAEQGIIGNHGSSIEMTSVSKMRKENHDATDRVNTRAMDIVPNNDDDNEYDSGIGCDICLLRYEKNDKVAWSKNEQCIHAYHLDCITDWLKKKITCPNCRCNYIPMPNSKVRPPNNSTSDNNNNTSNNNNIRQQQSQDRLQTNSITESNSIVALGSVANTVTNNNNSNDARNRGSRRSNNRNHNAARTSALLSHQRSYNFDTTLMTI